MRSMEVEATPASLLGALEDAAQRLARLPAPPPGAAMEQAERLLRVGDLVRLAAERAVAVADQTGAAKTAGHASTTAWLRAGGRTNAHGASAIRRNARQFRRLTATSEAVAAGEISHPMASAIAAACAVLTDDDEAQVAERTLLNLARDRYATVEKVARAGRYLRQVLDPDGHLGDEERAWRDRYMTAHLAPDGSMSGSYRLPPEAAARLQALFDKYSRNRAADDTRTQTQRNVDLLIQLLVQAVTAELLVVVNAETLPDSASEADRSDPAESEAADTPEAGNDAYADKADTAEADQSDTDQSDTAEAGDDAEHCGAPSAEAGDKHCDANFGDAGDAGDAAEDSEDTEDRDAAYSDGAERVDREPDDSEPDDSAPDDSERRHAGRPSDPPALPLQRSHPPGVDDGTDLGEPNLGSHDLGGLDLGSHDLGWTNLDADDCCPTCGRRTNRDIPGLLLPTGHPLPAPHTRRLARTSPLYRMVIDARGKPLDLGAAVRLVPPWMRRAVLATYDTCAYDDCPIPARWTEMDHVYPWATHHQTRLQDIAPGCDYHNRDRARRPHKYTVHRHPNGTWHITSGAMRCTPAEAMRCTRAGAQD